MILSYAILFILSEAITEGILKRFNKAQWLFNGFVQWVTAIVLFILWLIIALRFDGYYVPVWKLVTGFIFVRFMIFDVAYNLANGQKWNYYGTTKLYDRIMVRLGGWGWWIKLCLGIIGVCFLLGWQ